MTQPPTMLHPFADMIGMEVAGSCISRLTVAEHHMNPHGIVHGAVIYAPADT